MRLYLMLAIQGLAKSKGSFVLLVLAVACGVGFQIPNAANLDGYTQELVRQGLSRNTGHVVVTADDGSRLLDAREKAAALGELPFVQGVTIRMIHAGVLSGGETRALRNAGIVGVDPDTEAEVNDFCSHVQSGSCLAEPKTALLGALLARQMKVGIGDRVRVFVPIAGQPMPVVRTVRVGGILSGNGGFWQDRNVFLRLGELQRIVGGENEASSLSVFLDSPDRAASATQQIGAAFSGVNAQSWREANTFVAQAISASRTLTAISLLMVIFAVLIPVLALLYVHVLNERRHIAVLRSIGFGRPALFWVYLMKSAVVALVGVPAGIGIGLLLCRFFAGHPIFSSHGFTVYPHVSMATVFLPALVLFVVVLAAGLPAALRAASANPTLELREE